MLRSGESGDFADMALARAPDGRLSIGGLVFASLLRRALARTKSGRDYSEDIGRYIPKEGVEESVDAKASGVSPLWCESAFVELKATEVRPGIAMDREWGTAEDGKLFAMEIAPAGLQFALSAVYLAKTKELAEAFRSAMVDALWVIDTGIETIGGGWSYGFGRLAVSKLSTRVLSLSAPAARHSLWDMDARKNGWTDVQGWPDGLSHMTPSPAVIRPYWRVTATLGVAKGQLLAIASTLAPLSPDGIAGFDPNNPPDAFLFRSPRLGKDGKVSHPVTITGKALRQALLRATLERESATRGNGELKDLFGDTDRRGLISVADAEVSNTRSQVISRIQLCEHSATNMNLFGREYLTGGDFRLDALVDGDGQEADQLIDKVKLILNELDPANKDVPPGWHRLGSTTTATGQIALRDKFSYDKIGAREAGHEES